MQKEQNKPNPMEEKSKKGWVLVIIIIVVAALVVGGLWWKKEQEKKTEEAQKQAQQEEAKKEEQQKQEEAEAAKKAEEEKQKQKQEKEQQNQHQDWETYQSENANFSLQYPSTVKLEKEVNSLKLEGLAMTITENKIDDMEDEAPLGYGKITALKDEKELSQGKFGEEIDMPLKASEKVVKINNNQTNGKSFVVLGRFDVCDVTFEKQLIFYNNGYQIVVDLYGPVNKIEESMPKYFAVDQKQCGAEKMWDLKNQNVQTEFYQTLVDKKGSESAQDWFDTMDDITETVKIN